jgi:hypothetical protein
LQQKLVLLGKKIKERERAGEEVRTLQQEFNRALEKFKKVTSSPD